MISKEAIFASLFFVKDHLPRKWQDKKVAHNFPEKFKNNLKYTS